MIEQYQQIGKQANWVLRARLAGSLHLELEVHQDSRKVLIYEAEIKQLCGEIAEYFDDFNLLIEYLKSKENIDLNTEEGKLTIIEKSQLNKKKINKIGTIDFILKSKTEKLVEEQLIADIFQKCSIKQNLQPDQIKDILEGIAMTLQILLKQKNNKQKQKQSIQIKQDGSKLVKQQQIVFMKDFESYKQQIDIKFMKHTCAMDELKSEMEQQENVRKSVIKQLNLNINQNYVQMMKSLHELKQNIRDIQMQKISRQQLQSITESAKLTRNKVMKQAQHKIDANQWVNKQCASFKNLQIKNNSISTMDISCKIFGKISIAESNAFIIKFLNLKSEARIGVISAQYYKNVSVGGLSKKIEYYSTGESWDGKDQKKNQGSGFKKDEAVTVRVDQKIGEIEWRVGDQLRHKILCQKLKDPSIQWVPFVLLNNVSDSISIEG